MAEQTFNELITNWRWFQYVPLEAQCWLGDRLTTKTCRAGEELYAQGDRVEGIFGVASGVFKTYMLSPMGDETTLEEIAPGGWFPYFVPGEAPVYLSACVCVTSGMLATASLKVMREFGQLWPQYYQGLHHEFSDRLGVILGRIQLLSLHALDVRLAVYVLRMAHIRGREIPGGSILVESVGSQAEIGARVGGTRQRVNGVLGGWAKAGVLTVNKNSLILHDRQQLYDIAEASGFGIEEYLSGWHGGWGGGSVLPMS